MSTFVLVHGACHGPWCWQPVAAELRDRGHRTIAPELPSADPDVGLDGYVDLVIDALAGVDDDAVLVGHSLGGLTIPAVAARRPVAAMVFVAGIIGLPRASLADLAGSDADRDLPMGDDAITMFDNGTFRFTDAAALRLLYHDVEPALAAEAVGHLRPQRSLWTDVSPFDAWPETRISSIVCRDDRIVDPGWSERVAKERFGIEATLLDGGHSPMLSRPGDLTDALIAAAS